jgi:hypothetical protein
MKSYGNVIKYLIEGKTLVSRDGLFVRLDFDGNQVDLKGNPVTFSFLNPEIWSEYKEPQWYDNIPNEGVLCWLSSDVTDKKLIAGVVIRYENHGKPLFHTNFSSYYHATPVKPEECYKEIK